MDSDFSNQSAFHRSRYRMGRFSVAVDPGKAFRSSKFRSKRVNIHGACSHG